MNQKIVTKGNVKLCFTFSCVIIVAIMIGYWVYKFEIEDRDIGVVDFVPLDEGTDINLPFVTLCFIDPFVDERLKNWIPLINESSYLQYLRGDFYDPDLQILDYSDLTFHLGDYFLYAEDRWRNQSSFRNSSLSIEHKEVFSGFYFNSFVKCFSLKFGLENNRYLKRIRFHYDLSKLISDWTPAWMNGTEDIYLRVYYKIHYPGHFLLGDYPGYFYLYPTSIFQSVYIEELELLRRRNTRKKKCLRKNTRYDSTLIDKYLLEARCRVPYLLMNRNIAQCNSGERIKNGMLSYEKVKSFNIPKSCERIAKMMLIKRSKKKDSGYSTTWNFMIHYPDEFKVIMQSKEVDIHSLIGNIGGYLGLFLGDVTYINSNFILNVIELKLFFIYKFLSP